MIVFFGYELNSNYVIYGICQCPTQAEKPSKSAVEFLRRADRHRSLFDTSYCTLKADKVHWKYKTLTTILLDTSK